MILEQIKNVDLDYPSRKIHIRKFKKQPRSGSYLILTTFYNFPSINTFVNTYCKKSSL